MAILIIVIIGDDGHQNQYRVLRTASYLIQRINYDLTFKDYWILLIPAVRNVIGYAFGL